MMRKKAGMAAAGGVVREKSKDIPIRLVFESALELMSTTQLGGFKVR